MEQLGGIQIPCNVRLAVCQCVGVSAPVSVWVCLLHLENAGGPLDTHVQTPQSCIVSSCGRCLCTASPGKLSLPPCLLAAVLSHFR